LEDDGLSIPLPPDVDFDFEAFINFFYKTQRQYLRFGRWTLQENFDNETTDLVWIPAVQQQFPVAPLLKQNGGYIRHNPRKSRKSRKSSKKGRKLRKLRKSRRSKSRHH
jgi:hypothetical protein